jgi:hypothetical protein
MFFQVGDPKPVAEDAGNLPGRQGGAVLAKNGFDGFNHESKRLKARGCAAKQVLQAKLLSWFFYQ